MYISTIVYLNLVYRFSTWISYRKKCYVCVVKIIQNIKTYVARILVRDYPDFTPTTSTTILEK